LGGLMVGLFLSICIIWSLYVVVCHGYLLSMYPF